jgi:hypothetical protein
MQDHWEAMSIKTTINTTFENYTTIYNTIIVESIELDTIIFMKY